jgi:hypothetical protein
MIQQIRDKKKLDHLNFIAFSGLFSTQYATLVLIYCH